MVLVAGDPPVGFVTVGVVDGVAHIHRLAVRPSKNWQEVIANLLKEPCDWADYCDLDAITVTAFQDVAWDRLVYERLWGVPVRLQQGLVLLTACKGGGARAGEEGRVSLGDPASYAWPLRRRAVGARKMLRKRG